MEKQNQHQELWKKKDSVQYPNRRKLVPTVEVKLAAIAISLNVRLKSADMPLSMQERALSYTRSLVDAASDHRPNSALLARALKKVPLKLPLAASCYHVFGFGCSFSLLLYTNLCTHKL